MSESLIGLWWYTEDKEIWARTLPWNQGVVDYVDDYITLGSKLNHSNIWKEIVKENMDSPEDLIQQGYKSFSYGSVSYNRATWRFEIDCDASLYKDKKFQKKIMEYFHLTFYQVEFILRVD